jgi:hypothetical protein
MDMGGLDGSRARRLLQLSFANSKQSLTVKLGDGRGAPQKGPWNAQGGPWRGVPRAVGLGVLPRVRVACGLLARPGARASSGGVVACDTLRRSLPSRRLNAFRASGVAQRDKPPSMVASNAYR